MTNSTVDPICTHKESKVEDVLYKGPKSPYIVSYRVALDGRSKKVSKNIAKRRLSGPWSDMSDKRVQERVIDRYRNAELSRAVRRSVENVKLISEKKVSRFGK